MTDQDNKLTAFSISVIIAVGLFAALFAVEKVYNYDIWWHLRSGQWILENMALPHVDTFSFSTVGAEWVNSSWFSGPVFLWLYKLGGINLLILFKAGLIGMAFAGACFFMIRSGVHPFLAAVLLGYAVVVARFRFLLRPLLFMFPAIVVLFWAMARLKSDNYRLYCWLIPFLVLWTNLHGSAFIAPVFSAFLLAEALINRYRMFIFSRYETASIRFLSVLLLLVSVAVLITPYAIDLPRMIIGRSIVDDVLSNNWAVEEHLPLVWGVRNSYWALLIATGLSFLANFRRIRIFNLLVFIGTAVLAISSIRYIGFAALLQSVLLGLNLKEIPIKLPFKNVELSKIASVLSLIILIAVGWYAFIINFGSNRVYKWGFGVNEGRYPVAAVDYLEKVGFSGNIYNLWEQGGYVLWHLPQVRTLIDGRTLDAQIMLFDQLTKMNIVEFMIFLKNSDIKGALLNKENNTIVEMFQSLPGYSLKYFDEKFLIYLRNDFTVPAELGQVDSFQYIKPQTYEFSYLNSYAIGPMAGDVEKELRRVVALSPENFSVRFQLGYFLELMNQPEAIDVYIKAAELNPALGFSHFDIGLQAARFAIKHKAWGKAEKIIRLAIDNDRKTAQHYFLLGTVLYKKKNYFQAETAFMAVLNSDPDHMSTIQNLGYLFLDTDRLAKAEKYFKKAVELVPSSENALYGYAYALHRQGKPESEKYLKLFITQFPASRWLPNVKRFLGEGR